MHSPYPQSPLTIAAALMRAVWGGIVFGIGALRGEVDFDVVIQNWVSGAFHRLDVLLAQYQAGALPPVATPLVTVQQHAAVGERAELPQTSAPARSGPRDLARRREPSVEIQPDSGIRSDCHVAVWLIAMTENRAVDQAVGMILCAWWEPIFAKFGSGGASMHALNVPDYH